MGKKTSQYLGIIAALIVTNLVADLTGAVENAEIIEYIGCYDGENIQREKTLSFTRIEPSGLQPSRQCKGSNEKFIAWSVYFCCCIAVYQILMYQEMNLDRFRNPTLI
jgi:hypothetical protein